MMEKEKEEAEEFQDDKTTDNSTELAATNQFKPPIDEIEQIESAFAQEVAYEEISEVENSPMNEAVKQGEVSEGAAVQQEQPKEAEREAEQVDVDIPDELLKQFENDNKPASDAPEQEIDAEEQEDEEVESEGASATPKDGLDAKSGLSEADHHAGIAADSLIAVADNLLVTGGGFFVKIKKKKIYHDFDKKVGFEKADPNSLNAKIEEFNEKSIKRIKLDDEDKKQLRPVLKEVLKRKTKALTPEQQLMALAVSILIKHGKEGVEARQERIALQNHFDDVVKDHLKKIKTIKVEVQEKAKKVNEVELKAEEDGEKGEENQIENAA